MRIKLHNLYSLLFAMMLYILPAHSWAQERAVSGTVLDETGSPLPGVSVVVKGTTKGAATDFDGRFQLLLNNGEDVLTISYIGYTSKDITVGNQTSLSISLSPDADQLEEVVVIGYGSVKKDDLTGSVQSVTAADFNQGAITSPQELVNGKMPGVQIVNGGGSPGAAATIRIRGGSSLSASNDPLIIIDGVPVSNEGVAGMRNPLNTINPNDIETFTVLKDASATAIYGSRASAGVIIITTKKGSKGGLQINYAGNVSVSTPTQFVDVLDADKYREVLVAQKPAVEGLMGDASTNWQEEIYQNAISTDHNVSVAGNIADVLPVRASIGYNNSEGVLRGDNLQRTTATLNLNPKLFDDHLKVDASVKFSNIQNTFANQGAIGAAAAMDPTQPIKNENGEYFSWTNPDGSPINIAPANPVALLNQRTDVSAGNRVIANAQLDYKFHFLPELRANLNVATDRIMSEGETVTSPEAMFNVESLGKGLRTEYTSEKSNDLLDFYLQYAKEFGESRFDIMGGYSYQHFYTENTGREFLGDEAERGVYVDRYENYLVSFFGRANYSLKDRYMVTVTLRNDGSSRFAPENRWGLFPSAALAWNIKKEGFLAGSETISALKFRAGYGVTGQQDIFDNYPYFGKYTRGNEFATYTFVDPATGQIMTPMVDPNTGRNVPYLSLRPEAYNKDLKWEEATTYNVGIDYGFYDDRITGSLEAYYKQNTDLLNTVDIPVGSNFNNRVISNIGSMEARGVEFSINTKLVNNGDLFWDLGFNVAVQDNQITQLTQVESETYLGVETGDIAGGTGNRVQIHTVGHPAYSFFVYEQVYDNEGNPIENMFVDRNEDGKINDFDKYHFNQSAPQVLMGINTSVSYKNWEFSASGRANFGNAVYNNMAALNGHYNDFETSGQFLGNINANALETNFNTEILLSDYYVQDASFFRMDNIMVGYNVKSLFGDSINARVYGTVNNAFVISNYEGIDPEIFGGIDNSFYPRPRTFMLGVNVSF
ncbi:TonB-dependent receptor [Algivirga pacifica]|uniref:TonB-dependent receptor n=1 Tax=Algivirga pacifica TaxID=1162670 RepID=A0ABP9D2S7_9BACT